MDDTADYEKRAAYTDGDVVRPSRSELDAVRMPSDETGRFPAVPEAWGDDVTEDAASRLGGQAAADIEGFAKFGWRFVDLTDGIRADVRRGDLPAGMDQYAAVYGDERGHVLLGSGQVVGRSPPGMGPRAFAAVLEAEGLQCTYSFRSTERTHTLMPGPDVDVEELCVRLVRGHDFEAAWPELFSAGTEHGRPGDPRYRSKQWFWRNTGQTNGTPGADVAAERAWDVTRARGSVIALLDLAFAPDHEDLLDGVLPDTGYYDALPLGYQLVRSTAPTPSPGTSHGTLAAGMAGARSDNRRGGCGMAPRAGLRCIALKGYYSPEMFARAIEFALDPTTEPASAGGTTPSAFDGADVISISLSPPLGGTPSRTILENALEFATSSGREGRGTLVCWAAPNHSVSVDSNYVYKHASVCVVATTDHNDTVPRSGTLPNQGFGKHLQFLAPGQSIYSAYPSTSAVPYYSGTGCSYATPVVAGLIALVLSVDPDLDWTDVLQVIRDGCDKVDTFPYRRGFSRHTGYGRVNAGRTVARVHSDLTLRSSS